MADQICRQCGHGKHETIDYGNSTRGVECLCGCGVWDPMEPASTALGLLLKLYAAIPGSIPIEAVMGKLGIQLDADEQLLVRRVQEGAFSA